MYGVDYSLGPDNANFKIQVSDLIAKKLRLQTKVHNTQLKNVKVIALQEARDFIRSQSEAIQKHLTREHHKLVQRFIDYKDRTKARLLRLDERELTI